MASSSARRITWVRCEPGDGRTAATSGFGAGGLDQPHVAARIRNDNSAASERIEDRLVDLARGGSEVEHRHPRPHADVHTRVREPDRLDDGRRVLDDPRVRLQRLPERGKRGAEISVVGDAYDDIQLPHLAE